MTDNDKKFIGFAVAECAKEGVKVVFLPKTQVKMDNIECAGYFDNEEKELCIATKNPIGDWLSTLVHEFCHFKQWQKNESSFVNVCKNSKVDSDMWNWLNGEDIPMKRVKKSIHAYRLMELNCEKMAVKYIEEFGLSINKEQYILAANVYVLFYGLIEETRKWFKYSPYDDRLFNLVPKKLVKGFKLPKGFRKMALSVCY